MSLLGRLLLALLGAAPKLVEAWQEWRRVREAAKTKAEKDARNAKAIRDASDR